MLEELRRSCYMRHFEESIKSRSAVEPDESRRCRRRYRDHSPWLRVLPNVQPRRVGTRLRHRQHITLPAGNNRTTMTEKLALSLLAIVVQIGRERLSKRSRKGLACAKANGACLGRRKRPNESCIENIRSLRELGRSYCKIADISNVSLNTVHKDCEGWELVNNGNTEWVT